MDDLDRSILRALWENCRITYQTLAVKYGVTANAIKKRVKKFETSGVIASYRIELTRGMIDAEQVFGLILTDGSQDEEKFVTQIGSSPYVIAAASYTGGHYALIAEYRSSNELWELGGFLRGLPGVQNVETHALLLPVTPSMDLKKLHLRVLQYLLEDPRITIADLAQKSKLTARRVRRIVQELIESPAVNFRALLELGAAESLPFLLRLSYNEKKTDYRKVVERLNKLYPSELWETYISAIEPTIFCLFTAENLTAVDTISRAIRREPNIDTVTVLINKHHQYFTGLRHQYLSDLIAQTETS